MSGNGIGCEYDAAGNLIALTYPDSKVVTYEYDEANTLWTSVDPDMYFIVSESREVTHAQITVNDEVIELICYFVAGSGIVFDDLSGYDPETGLRLSGVTYYDIIQFRGLCRFRPNRLVVTITDNYSDFLDDTISEIVFIREDINE